VVKLSGMKGMKSALKKYPQELSKTARRTLHVYGNKMAKSARKDHRYNRQSGNLDRSIEAVVDKKKVEMKLWINPTLLKSGKYNYGLIQHEGSYKGYKKSKAVKKRYGSSTLKTGFGVLHDHFIVRGWAKHIKQMNRALKKDMVEAAQKLRLK